MGLKDLQAQVKDGLGAIKELTDKAKDHKADLEKSADALRRVADLVKALAANPDPVVLGDLKTEFEQVNKTLIAMASAQQELDRKSVDWEKVGNGVLAVVSVTLKIATMLA